MGVTIHFEGRLKSPESLERLVQAARGAAADLGWPCQIIREECAQLPRVRDEQDWDYVGPTAGIELLPHKDSEPLRLEFDRELYVQEFIKTQFAGPDVHVEVVNLLRQLETHFAILSVDDEGEYWESNDRTILEGHIGACDQELARILRETPRARGPVRLPSGRLADFVS
jgi:hypothetical protein